MLFSLALFPSCPNKPKSTVVGTVIELGEWPQTVLPESSTATIDETPENSRTQGMFTYYKGSDGAWYYKGTENASNTDIKYSDSSYAKTGGTDTRWFKVEPIQWRILTDNYNGKKLIVAEKGLDGCTFFDSTDERKRGSGSGEKTIYANNYAESRVRAFLNGLSYMKDAAGSSDSSFVSKGFLQTAFNDTEREKIIKITIDNSIHQTENWNDLSTHPEWDVSKYICENTQDKIFLLSLKECKDFAQKSREITDFAYASGIEQFMNSYVFPTRSPSSDANAKNVVYSFIDAGLYFSSVKYCFCILPALCIE